MAAPNLPEEAGEVPVFKGSALMGPSPPGTDDRARQMGKGGPHEVREGCVNMDEDRGSKVGCEPKAWGMANLGRCRSS